MLFYWAVGAQPENEEKELIDAFLWASFTGSVDNRTALLFQAHLVDITHSVYQPLLPLLRKLADILSVDGHWVESSDPRKDPGYITEAFQRLILEFILKHREENFMQHRIEREPRCPKLGSVFLSPPSDTSRKRTLSEPTTRGGTKRLRVGEKTIEVGRRCPQCDLF